MALLSKFCRRCDKNSERYKDGRCKVCTLARHAIWATKNRDRVNANSKAWNERHGDQKRATAAAYRKRERDAINARRKTLRKIDQSLERLKTAKRRTLKRASNGKLSRDIVFTLFKAQKGLCACCAKPLEGKFHLDHKTPLSRGGRNADDNVQLLLPICNLKKYTLTHDEFLARKAKACP